MLESFSDIWQHSDKLLGVGLVIVFIVLVTLGRRRTWNTVDALLLSLCGAGFALLPHQFLGAQVVGELTAGDVELSRIYGVTLLGSCVMWLWTRQSRDATVSITIMMSRVFASSMFLVAQAFSYFSVSKKKKSGESHEAHVQWIGQFVTVLMLPTLLWLLGNLYHLCRSHDFSTYPQHNLRLNNSLRVDAWFQLLTGAVLVAFPTQFIQAIMVNASSNLVALHVTRTTGILCISEAIVGLQAPGFLFDRDKIAVFVTRLISVTLQLSAVGVAVYHGVISQQALLSLLALSAPIIINSLVGLFTEGTDNYHLPASPNKHQ